ncbi:MAG: preprotein translocase subunit SecE [Lachnospiraceae bacterium]|nr:preprotein translocase subunit SecE [Lachnospiraceae bacterium]
MADSTKKTSTEKTKDEAPKAAKKSWWKGIKSEFKKISWPSRGTVVKETSAVIVISVILGLIISLIDTVLQFGLNFIM